MPGGLGEKRGRLNFLSSTDSELLFLLAMARVARGAGLPEAMHDTLAHTTELMRGRGIDKPLRFAAALADGEQLHAFRYASDDQPPTLYQRRTHDGVVIASEPLDDDEDDWHLIAADSMLSL